MADGRIHRPIKVTGIPAGFHHIVPDPPCSGTAFLRQNRIALAERQRGRSQHPQGHPMSQRIGGPVKVAEGTPARLVILKPDPRAAFLVVILRHKGAIINIALFRRAGQVIPGRMGHIVFDDAPVPKRVFQPQIRDALCKYSESVSFTLPVKKRQGRYTYAVPASRWGKRVSLQYPLYRHH